MSELPAPQPDQGKPATPPAQPSTHPGLSISDLRRLEDEQRRRETLERERRLRRRRR